MEVLEVNEILQKFLALIFSLLIFQNARISSKIFKSVLHPAVIFSSFWFIFTLLPVILLWEVPINSFAIGFILVVCLVISLSGLPFNNKIPIISHDIIFFQSNLLRIFFNVSIILSLLFSLQIIAKNGIKISEFLFDFYATASQIAKNRTHEEIDYGIYGVLSVFFTYFAAILGSIRAYYGTSKKQKYFRYFLALLPALFVMLSQSSKIIFLVSVILIIAVHFLILNWHNNTISINLKNIRKFLIPFLLFFPLIIISFMSREGYNNFFSFNEAYAKLSTTIKSYLFGSLFAFSDFFSAYCHEKSISQYEIERYNLGYYSFKPIFDMLGGRKYFPPGYYPDNFNYNGVIQTNVYTAFRGFLQDFGIFGTLIFFYVFGSCFNLAYTIMRGVRFPFISSSLYIMFIAFSGLSFIINIFTARYIFLLCTAFTFLLFFNYLVFLKRRS